MLNILLDGISILNLYKEGIVVFGIASIGMGYFAIKQTLNNKIAPRIRLLSYFCIGSLALSTVCYVLFLLAYFWPGLLRPGVFLILFFSIVMVIRGLWVGDIKVAWDIPVICMGLIVFFLLILRLSFLKHIILPPYSDSPIHYQIVYGLLQPEATAVSKLSFGNIFTNYYHFGFHSIVAWLALTTGFDPANAISLVGQLFLVIAPLSILLLVTVLTNDSNGALFSGLLAAIGWSMPAFAVNWGKFPALISLALFSALIALFCLYIRSQSKVSGAFYWGIILVLGIVFIHTRILICLVLALIAYYVSNRLASKNEIEFPQSVRLSLLFVLSLWPISQLIANFYLRFPVWLILLILLPFAFQVYPKLSVGIFFYTTGMWLITLVPHIIFKNDQMLLDRQFLEIMLYIPFSVMGALGFAGMIKKIPLDKPLRWVVVPVLVGGVLFNFQHSASLMPSSCCDYFRESDRLAFHWLRENASKESLVLISSFDDNNRVFGTDAGIWIYPLAGINTNKLPFDTAWHVPNVLEEVCSIGAEKTYIYSGGKQNSFDNTQLMQEEWIDSVFKSGGTEIYEVSKCS